MSKSTIIIVWGWSKNGVIPLNTHNLWHTPSGHRLVCTDVHKNATGQELLHSLVSDHANDGPVLVFLHKTEPHSYVEADRSTILDAIDPTAARQVRVRLFGGGIEPVYFGWESELGMLGLNGCFPTTVTGPSEVIFEEKKSSLFVEEEKDKICQEHFDYVWDIYWHPPYKLIFSLAERFRFWTDGCELGEGLGFSTYLKHYDLLRQQLICFAAKGGVEENLHSHFASDYNYDSYELLLRETNPALFEKLQLTREAVRNMLEAKPVTKKDAQDVVDKTFNELFGLFKEIAFGSA